MRTPRKSKEELKIEKEGKKVRECLKKYHLTNIDDKDLESMGRILTDLLEVGTLEGIPSMRFPPYENYKIRYLSAITRQNFIIIRKLDELIRKLGK